MVHTLIYDCSTMRESVIFNVCYFVNFKQDTTTNSTSRHRMSTYHYTCYNYSTRMPTKSDYYKRSASKKRSYSDTNWRRPKTSKADWWNCVKNIITTRHLLDACAAIYVPVDEWRTCIDTPALLFTDIMIIIKKIRTIKLNKIKQVLFLFVIEENMRGVITLSKTRAICKSHLSS